MNAAAQTTQVALSNVTSVYSGKRNKCCCGCAGKHTWASHATPNYENSAVSDRTVKLLVNKINAALVDGTAVATHIADDFISVETETRLYVAYMR